jgi:hypothetical protein
MTSGTQEDVERWCRLKSEYSVGIVCGNVIGIDVDLSIRTSPMLVAGRLLIFAVENLWCGLASDLNACSCFDAPRCISAKS